MRLIDADALINALVNDCNKDQTKALPVWIEKRIDAQPTVALLKEQETATLYKCPNCGTWVSAENVVRCKDCKNVECEGVEGFLVCELSGFSHHPEFFCADGERSE